MLLALVMVFSMAPVPVWAAGGDVTEAQTVEATAASAELTVEGEVASLNGVTISDDANGTLSVANGVVTVTVTGAHRQTKTTTITVKNNADTWVLVSFDYKASGYEKWTLSEAAEGNFDIVLSSGQGYPFELTAPSNTKTATVELSNICVKAPADNATVTVKHDSAMGSVTAEGGAVNADGTITVAGVGASGVALTADAAEGMRFLGWKDQNGKMWSDAASYTFVPFAENVELTAVFVRADLAEFSVNDTPYSDLNAAIKAAEAAKNKTIVVSKDGVLPAGEYTIPSGVTLLVPYNSNNSVPSNGYEPNVEGSSKYGDFSLKSITESVPYRTLKLESGANLTVSGTMIVNSGVFAAAVTDISQPHGPYGLVVLENGSQITIKGGKLNCYGFIMGTYDAAGNYTGGKVVAESGTIYELFQVRDMRGTNASLAAEDKLTFPLSQYYVQNIEAQYEIYPGAASKGALVASTGIISKCAEFTFIGSNGLFQLTSGKLVRYYDPIADRIEYTLETGDLVLDAINLTLMGESLNSSSFYLGINGNLSINLNANTSATVKQKIKLLPGAQINVAKDATLTVAENSGALFLYDSEDWGSTFVHHPYTTDYLNDPIMFNNAGTAKSVVRYSPSRAAVKGKITEVVHGSAKLHVEGKLIAYGNVYSTAGYTKPDGTKVTAGNYDNILTGTGTFENKTAYGSVTLNEFYSNTPTWATVATTPLLALQSGAEGVSVASFTNTDGTQYTGYKIDAGGDAAYLWTSGEQNVITVTVMASGQAIDTWATVAYTGMDLSGYYTDEACTEKATADFSGDKLYMKAAARIGEAYYTYLRTAVENAGNGDTVTLLEDVTLNAPLTVEADQNITLDLNNHSITSAGDVLVNNGTLNIYGGEAGEGTTPGALICTGAGTTLTNNGTIGTIGGENSKVAIESVNVALYNASGATIHYIGGKDGHVTITQRTGENIYLRTIRNYGTIGTIGGENAVVEIDQHYEYTKGGSGNNPETLANDGTINLIGGQNAQVLIEQFAASGAGFCLRVNKGEVKKIGGEDVNRVEIVAAQIPVYIASSGKISEIAKNTLFVAKARFASQSAIWNAGTITSITGGWFYGKTNTLDAIFKTGDNKSNGKDAIASVADGYVLTYNAGSSVMSLANGISYGCYGVIPVGDAQARIGGRYYTTLKSAVSAAAAGETVTLLKDVVYSGNGLVVAKTTLDVTLDLNNHSITADSYVILNRGRINITGGAMTDANGEPMTPGKLITKGTEKNSSCIYNQLSDSGSTFVGEIGTIGGNLELIDEGGQGRAVIYNSAASIEQIGTEGSKIKITGPGKLLEVTAGATLGALGGEGSHLEMSQTGTGNVPAIYVAGTITNIGYGGNSLVELTSVAKSIYVASGASIGALGGESSTVTITQNSSGAVDPWLIHVEGGTIDHIGDENATVKLIQNSAGTKNNGHGGIVRVNGGAVNNIGTQSGAKVLMDQTMLLSGDCGWGLDVRSGTIGNIGSDDSLVEVIADHCPVYLEGTITNITGNTLMVGKRDYNSESIAMWMATNKTVGSITGGFFAQDGVSIGESYADYIFDTANQTKITNAGYTLSKTIVERYSETTKDTYQCIYVCQTHEHTTDQEPVIEWITENGQVVLSATAACQQAGCYEQVVAKSVATVSGEAEGDVYKLTYTATVNLGGEDITKTKTDELQYAGKKTMKYDDRINGTDIRIIDMGEPVETSLKVGTNERDDAVITVYGNKLVATGIGEAVAFIDNGVYEITVEKAVIDLFMITGHSVGMGSKGNPDESVVIDDGSAYSFTVTNNPSAGSYSYSYTDVITEYEGVGLGYAAEKRPAEVDNFTEAGAGVIGEDSGLAWKWNQLTGHKVYVVNSAVGSTSMYHWYMNTTNSTTVVPILDNAIQNFTYARQIIQNEVDAGHFEMGTMTMINHSSANYSSGAIEQAYDDINGQEWFEKVLGDISKAMEVDWDNDGAVEEGTETMSIGFVPIWTRPKDTTSTSIGVTFGNDKPAVLYMGASDAYADYFVASLIGREDWGTDEKVAAYFKDYVQAYSVQNGEKLDVPTSNLELYPYELGDYVHYTQFAYNEMGMDVAQNVYDRLYGTPETVSLKLYKTDGKTEVAAEGTEALNLSEGDTLKLVPVVDPISVSDLTFKAEGSLKIQWPLVIYADGAGAGSLTISYNDQILKTITIDVEAVAKIGETTYLSIADAIEKAEAGDTVVLLKDIELSSGIVVAEDKNFTLDLNNHSITVAGTAITNYGTLNILGGEVGGDKTAGKITATSGNAIVNSGTIGTIGGNLELKGDAAIHVNGDNARIDLIGGEGAAVTLNSTGNNTIYVEKGTIGTIGATGSGMVTINAKHRGILAMSKTTKEGVLDIEAITGNVTINSHGGAIYVASGNKVGTVGGNGTVKLNREAHTTSNMAPDAAIFITSGSINTIGGPGGTVEIDSVYIGIGLNSGSIGTIGAGGTVNVTADSIALNVASGTKVTTIGSREEDTTASTVTFVSDITATGARYCANVNGTIETIGGKNANITFQVNNKAADHSAALFINGKVDAIGGENATVNFIQNNTDATTGKFRIGIWPNSGSIGTLGVDGTVNIISNAYGIYMGGSDSAKANIENIATAGTVNITGPVVDGVQTACTYGIYVNTTSAEMTVNEIGNLGNGGNAYVNASTNALYMVKSANVGAIGGSGGEVTLISTNGYTVNMQGGEIGTIGGTNAKVNLLCDDASGNTVVLNMVKAATVGTIGGENAEIILYQSGATTGIQYGILMNGISSTNEYAQINKIGAGAKFVEVIVDDCPVFINSTSKILEIDDCVLMVARTVSTKDNSSYVFNSSPANAIITGGKFSRGNSADINAVLAEANRTGKVFTEKPVEVVANADGKTYDCFIVHPEHDYVKGETAAPTCVDQGYTTYTCSVCGDSKQDDFVNATGHSYGEPTWSWTGDDTNGYTAATATFRCSCGDVQTERDDEIEVTTTPATETAEGMTVYTAKATFEGNEYTATKEVTIPMLAHTHKLTQIEAKAATCVDTGYDAYEYCSACDYTTKGDDIPATGVHTYKNGVCTGCGDVDAKESTQHASKVTYQIGLIEPWFLRINIRLTNESSATINYDGVTNYGAYFVRRSELANPDVGLADVTMEAVQKGVHYSCEDGAVQITGSGSQTYLTVDYQNDIYTYEMGDTIIGYFYFEKDGVTYHTEMRERSILDLLNERKDSTSATYSEKEKAVYHAMVKMNQDIIEYRSGFESLEEREILLPISMEESNLGEFVEATSFESKFVQQIVLIEPWGLRLNARVYNKEDSSVSNAHLDYNQLDDFGIIVYHDKSGSSNYKSAEELLNHANKSELYVYSKSNGRAYLSGDGNKYFTAQFDHEIYTYQLDSDLYFTFYIKVDGSYQYTNFRCTNIKELAAERAESTSATYGAEEKVVYSDMVALYEATKEYRDWYFSQNG